MCQVSLFAWILHLAYKSKSAIISNAKGENGTVLVPQSGSTSYIFYEPECPFGFLPLTVSNKSSEVEIELDDSTPAPPAAARLFITDTVINGISSSISPNVEVTSEDIVTSSLESTLIAFTESENDSLKTETVEQGESDTETIDPSLLTSGDEVDTGELFQEREDDITETNNMPIACVAPGK